MITNEKLNKISLPLLRFGLAFVFLWFGFQQLQNPEQWISFLPFFVSSLPISGEQFVLLNGLFEVIGGTLLVFGTFTNIVAFILSIHLFSIALSVGFNSIAVRDIGLAFAMLYIAISGAGTFSIDSFIKKRKEVKLNEWVTK